ncbi:MAG: CBS domain-containing protein [Anaerolineales bacterium]|nr:CBS domain-containing protein [Anaerolineales bacterium]MCB8950528.1 CBS domain-containing protein [Ardenticatenales bacterium]
MTTQAIPLNLSRKDFVSDQEVRWCPGCGDYSILAQVQKVLPELNVPRENIVFISGIGCSSRFPYYMNTYGIHSIHGRAPTLATGLAISNPDLRVFVITGDGDGLSIGGNHLIHALRRNINLNILLFNNRIYGLTKGQYSPTSRQGAKTKSSPMGAIEQPINPIALALASEATFVARTLDAHTAHLGDTLLEAALHRGSSFVEIYQNCVIFNPTEWEGWTDRKVRDDHLIYLEHGKPLVFGKNRDKGIILEGFRPKVVELGNGFTEADLLVHDETSKELAYILGSMEHPEFPVPLGVIRRVHKTTYGEGLRQQIETATAQRGVGDLDKLYRAADSWTVDEHATIEPSIQGQLAGNLDEAYVDELDQERPEPTAEEAWLATDVLANLSPKQPIMVQAGTSVANAVQMMNTHRIGCVVVTDDSGVLSGILTEYDILMRVAGQVEDLSKAHVDDYMTRNPYTLMNNAPIAEAIHLMSDHGFRHLPIVDERRHPIGIISFRDVVHYLKGKLNLGSRTKP